MSEAKWARREKRKKQLWIAARVQAKLGVRRRNTDLFPAVAAALGKTWEGGKTSGYALCDEYAAIHGIFHRSDIGPQGKARRDAQVARAKNASLPKVARDEFLSSFEWRKLRMVVLKKRGGALRMLWGDSEGRDDGHQRGPHQAEKTAPRARTGGKQPASAVRGVQPRKGELGPDGLAGTNGVTERTNTDTREFIAMFCAAYKEHRGAKYFVRRPKDLVLAKLLLETYSLEEAQAMVTDLLTVQDEWIAGTDRGIGILVTKASWLANRLAQQAQPQTEYWADVCQREHGGQCINRWAHEMKLREAS